jgi:hypothetical protein
MAINVHRKTHTPPHDFSFMLLAAKSISDVGNIVMSGYNALINAG